MLGQSMVPMLQRFYLVIAILVGNGSGTLSRARLETMCQQSAERLSMIYGLHSPDFFNKTLFHDFIKMLENQNVLRRNSEGTIEFDEDITSIGVEPFGAFVNGILDRLLQKWCPERHEDGPVPSGKRKDDVAVGDGDGN